jgi:hypothetical protein
MIVRLRDWSPIALEATICELMLGQLYRVQLIEQVSRILTLQ